MPAPTLPTATQQLKDARRSFIQATKARAAATDLVTRAETSLAAAKDTLAQATAACMTARQQLDDAFTAFKDGPDEP